AIIDNPSDLDWKGVTLSLVSGRPVSFIQDLYAPLYLDRPTLPLAIAGIAAARSLETGLSASAEDEERVSAENEAPAPERARKAETERPAPAMAATGAYSPAPPPASPLGASSALETTRVDKA